MLISLHRRHYACCVIFKTILLMRKRLVVLILDLYLNIPHTKKNTRESFLWTSADVNVIGVRCSFDTGGSLEDQITLAVTLKHFYYDWGFCKNSPIERLEITSGSLPKQYTRKTEPINYTKKLKINETNPTYAILPHTPHFVRKQTKKVHDHHKRIPTAALLLCGSVRLSLDLPVDVKCFSWLRCQWGTVKPIWNTGINECLRQKNGAWNPPDA